MGISPDASESYFQGINQKLLVQEHLTVLRTMVMTFPHRFPELAVLADSDEEIDFFKNIAHIQMHRRSRALARLGRVRANTILCFVLSLTMLRHACSSLPNRICTGH